MVSARVRVKSWPYRGGPARSCPCQGYVESKSRRDGTCPLVYVGMVRRIRRWDTFRLRSRHVCCFRLCIVWRLNRDARDGYALLREEKGFGLFVVAVVVVEVFGGRVRDGRVCLSYA